jgi:hypothetical protein
MQNINSKEDMSRSKVEPNKSLDTSNKKPIDSKSDRYSSKKSKNGLIATNSGFLTKECVIEAAYLAEELNNEEEFALIKALYSNLKYSSRKERTHLVNLLVAYKKNEQIQMIYEFLFDKNHRYEAIYDLPEEFTSFKKKPDLSMYYKPEDFILDSILSALENDDVYLVNYIYDKYQATVDQKSIQVTQAIIYSIIYQYENNLIITNPAEKFKLIDKV